jgi:hypothetical protein
LGDIQIVILWGEDVSLGWIVVGEDMGLGRGCEQGKKQILGKRCVPGDGRREGVGEKTFPKEKMCPWRYGARENVATLTLGSQPRQGVARLWAKRKLGSHISCPRECKRV